MNKITVYASILNWNKAAATLLCMDSLLSSVLPVDVQLSVFVVDNGSALTDWQALSEGLSHLAVTLIRNSENLGFSGGHNIVMQQAIDDGADYVWLVNNDGFSYPDTLEKLIKYSASNLDCGALSPIIKQSDNNNTIDFCGAYHDWSKQMLVHFKYDQKFGEFNNHIENQWLVGAAILFRVDALRSVGLLDEDYFAYFEDNDICARLNAAGWKCRVVSDCYFSHDNPIERPPYFYYLTTRNDFLFWVKNTPKGSNSLLKLRLIDRALYRAEKLSQSGSQDKATACLLGCLDGLLGCMGKPLLDRSIPWYIIILVKLYSVLYKLCYSNHEQ